MYHEYVTKIVLRGYLFRSYVLIAIAFVACFLVYKKTPILAIFEAVAGVLVIVSMFFMPEAITRDLLKKELGDYHEGLALCTIVFDEDQILLSLPQKQSSYAYELISDVYSLKTCYVFKVGKDHLFLAKKGCFVSGDESFFEAFILEKCPQIGSIKSK
jgi:hypothetical protein